MESGLTLLAQASMPLSYWDEAFRTAVLIINRLPTHTLSFSTPLETLYQVKPTYLQLKVFGCECYPNTRPYNTHKLDFRSQQCIFLGYSINHKGYKCLAKLGRIFISRDVVFNEGVFHYPALFPTDTPTASASPQSLPSPLISASPDPTTEPLNPDPVPVPEPNHIPEPILALDPVPVPDLIPVPASIPVPGPIITPVIAPTPTHHMVTRSKNGISKPKAFLASKEPETEIEALASEAWKQAMTDEYLALLRNGTWSLVPLPPNRKAIGSKWVFKLKQNSDGSLLKHKARFVAKGFKQIAGFDYHETFSPVVKQTTIRVVLTLALARGWSIRQLDVNNAFLNGDLKEEVYLSQPEGFPDKSSPNLVCRLHKSLYGLKQAPRAWFDKLHHVLLAAGFCSAKSDQSLFIKVTASLTQFVLVYVDDILVISSEARSLDTLVAHLDAQFKLKDLGDLDYFLGIQVHHVGTGFLLSQKKYALDLLTRVNMHTANGIASPMASSAQLSAYGGPEVDDPQLYRSIVGALQYLTITRHELSFAVNKVCQFMQQPLADHWRAVKRILRYVAGTLDFGLHIRRQPVADLSLVGFSDADWASDGDDRKSTSGVCVFLGSNLVAWSSRKQHTISRSSAEAEFRSLACLVFEVTWIGSLLRELNHVPPQRPVLWCDNLSAVLMAANPVLHARTKHIEIDLYFVREKVLHRLVDVRHVPAIDQTADVRAYKANLEPSVPCLAFQASC